MESWFKFAEVTLVMLALFGDTFEVDGSESNSVTTRGAFISSDSCAMFCASSIDVIFWPFWKNCATNPFAMGSRRSVAWREAALPCDCKINASATLNAFLIASSVCSGSVSKPCNRFESSRFMSRRTV